MKISNKDLLYVGIQIILFLAYILEYQSLKFSIPIFLSFSGFIISILGIIIISISIYQLRHYISPFPTPISNSKLIENGMYKWIRHPIYTGVLLTTFGFGIFSHSGYKIIIFIALYILFYFKSKYEEEKLSERFSSYPEYKKRTGRFFIPLFRLEK